MLKSWGQTCRLGAPSSAHNFWYTVTQLDNEGDEQIASCCLIVQLNFRLCFQEAAEGMGDIYTSRSPRRLISKEELNSVSGEREPRKLQLERQMKQN